MGFNFRKSIKIGPARVNVSKSGVGYSVGAGGFRYTKRAGSKSKKKSIGLWDIIRGFLVLIIVICIIGFVADYWKIILAIAGLAVVGCIVYAFYKGKKTVTESEQLEVDPEQGAAE